MSKTKFYLFVLLFCLIASFFLYGNMIRGEFVGDDAFFAFRPEIRQWSYLPRLFKEPLDVDVSDPSSYRPLSVATFALNFILFGESSTSFHLVNIILNALAAFLVFVLINKLFKNPGLAVFTVLLFSFFPIHNEAVANL